MKICSSDMHHFTLVNIKCHVPIIRPIHKLVYTVSQKMAQLWNSIVEIVQIDFDDIWQKCSKDSRIEFACFSFHVCLLFITLSSLKLHTENNACMLCASVSCWARLFLQHSRCRSLWIIRKTDDRWILPLHVKFFWLFNGSSWLSNNHSTVRRFHQCALHLPLVGHL